MNAQLRGIAAIAYAIMRDQGIAPLDAHTAADRIGERVVAALAAPKEAGPPRIPTDAMLMAGTAGTFSAEKWQAMWDAWHASASHEAQLAAPSKEAGAEVDGLSRIAGLTFYLHENPDLDKDEEPVRLVMGMSVGNDVFCHRATQGDNGICANPPVEQRQEGANNEQRAHSTLDEGTGYQGSETRDDGDGRFDSGCVHQSASPPTEAAAAVGEGLSAPHYFWLASVLTTYGDKLSPSSMVAITERLAASAAPIGVAAKLASLKEEVDQLAYRVDRIHVDDTELHLTRISERLALIIKEVSND